MNTQLLEQGSDEWKMARCGIATASKFNDVLSKTKYGVGAQRKNYMTQLVIERLTKQPTETYASAAMVNGTEYEPVARLAYELLTGNTVTETGLWLHGAIACGASPDGLVNDDGLIEIKNPLPSNHVETLKTATVPKQYMAQVQGQMWITGRDWCDFVSYCAQLPENAQMIIIRVNRDEDYIANLEDEVIKFMQEVDEQVAFVESYGTK